MTKARDLARISVNASGAIDAANLGNAVPADGSITSAKIADGAITNADVNAAAGIAASKLSGLAAIATSGSASDLTVGTVPTARMPTYVSSVNGQSGAVTVSTGSGTVTSVATGNGLQGGTITTSGTLSITAPGYQTVGSYIYGAPGNSGGPNMPNSNYSGGSIWIFGWNGEVTVAQQGGVPGTWRALGASGNSTAGLLVRVS